VEVLPKYSFISTASGYCPLYFLRAADLSVIDRGMGLGVPDFAVSLLSHVSLLAMSVCLAI
jgi:hypothetical protein